MKTPRNVGLGKYPHKLKDGQHPHHALSAFMVRNKMKPGRYADGNGLHLVIDPSGARRWILRTVVGGKRCDIGLGSVALVTLHTARKEATRLREMARSGGDPLAQRRKERRTVPTFREAAEQVHKLHSPSWKNEKHAEQWIASLKKNVFDELGNVRCDRISQADVLRVLSPLWLKRPETARRIRQRIKLVMAWAKANGYRTGDNPVEGLGTVLPAQTDTPHHMASMPYAEVPAFVTTLRKSDAGNITKLLFEFLILCACRTNEAIGAQWSEVDLEGKVWTIPSARMKAKKEHRAPLSARCVEILNEARRFNHTRYPLVFPNLITGERLSNMVLLMQVRRMKLPYTVHGFRSSFRDWASEKTHTPHAVMEAALAHAEHDKTVAAYARSDLLDLRRKLMEQWARHCTTTKAEVVQIGTVA
ncbi:MAG: tyrosine-type recombinase/integrase [Gammaproteobacteria bacterium]